MSATFTLARTEARLLTREWATMIFAFVFPPLTMLIVAGSFGSDPDEAFNHLAPDQFYVAGYFAIPIAAMALIGLPMALAAYRERGVLRRFQAFGVPGSSVIGTQSLVAAGLIAIGSALVLAVALPTYGIPGVERPLELLVGFVTGTATMLLLGTACGLTIGSARGAQAFGLLLFFPMFLLSGGGPPPDVMPAVMRRLSDVLPLTHVVGAIRDPWLDDGSIVLHLVGLAVWAVVGTAGTIVGLRRLNRSA
ncbi:ABC transporter permease [Desertimonas flava]|uniref:ABC transporter permease n=1 Tax=Desertimonas flava TaxID=2064846 RepID=UPI000E355E1B|nr:ABC transporter permease [Desertimonas flava]